MWCHRRIEFLDRNRMNNHCLPKPRSSPHQCNATKDFYTNRMGFFDSEDDYSYCYNSDGDDFGFLEDEDSYYEGDSDPQDDDDDDDDDGDDDDKEENNDNEDDDDSEEEEEEDKDDNVAGKDSRSVNYVRKDTRAE
ncbi:trigger factor-like isoform X2 [Macadamia integrifolia]|uniref:trigger factor-like isoform X2 n=1 Tax=Macadamia integrifolia TaxID=60698 RepID=UPI001C502514|nr:trigger factor-like isoform X2 [Macadamia integrifolia]